MKLLRDKVALITGGTRGIGKSIVLEFAEQGAHLAFTYAGREDLAQEVALAAQAFGVKALPFKADAADFAKAQEVVDAVVKELGRLDTVVNNAGIAHDNLILRMTEEQWDKVIDTNLKSLFNYTKASAKQMMSQRAGTYVNISSVVGLSGNAGQSNYAASKAGCIGFTKSIAQELASRGIRANVVAPGYIATEMTEAIADKGQHAWLNTIPLKRAGTAKEVAQLCVFLASDWSSYITGQTIQINGGMG